MEIEFDCPLILCKWYIIDDDSNWEICIYNFYIKNFETILTLILCYTFWEIVCLYSLKDVTIGTYCTSCWELDLIRNHFLAGTRFIGWATTAEPSWLFLTFTITTITIISISIITTLLIFNTITTDFFTTFNSLPTNCLWFNSITNTTCSTFKYTITINTIIQTFWTTTIINKETKTTWRILCTVSFL